MQTFTNFPAFLQIQFILVFLTSISSCIRHTSHNPISSLSITSRGHFLPSTMKKLLFDKYEIQSYQKEAIGSDAILITITLLPLQHKYLLSSETAAKHSIISSQLTPPCLLSPGSADSTISFTPSRIVLPLSPTHQFCFCLPVPWPGNLNLPHSLTFLSWKEPMQI